METTALRMGTIEMRGKLQRQIMRFCYASEDLHFSLRLPIMNAENL